MEENVKQDNGNEMKPELLREHHTRAIELKFKGLKYEDIAKECGVATSTIEKWFMTGGFLFDKYYEYAERKLAEREKDSRIFLKAQIHNAVAVMNNAMLEKFRKKMICTKCGHEQYLEINIPTRSRLTAAIEVINRVLGKAPENINLSGEIKTNPYDQLGEDELARRLKEIDNGGITEEAGN